MLKRLINELRCSVTITTTGPVLVKSGHASVSGPDMTPVRTYRNNSWEVYLPGSSLKGVIRSHLEKVCRTLKADVVCNPFVTIAKVAKEENHQLICPSFADVSCGNKFEVRSKGEVKIERHIWQRPENQRKKPDNEEVYADSCPICRLFGSTFFIGRLSVGDAYLVTSGSGRTETRDGVGIDRFTGGASRSAKFELEAVSTGIAFKADILLRNFECWQIGMLLIAVTDLRDGLIRVGSGRSRGLGAVKGEIGELTIHTLAPTPTRAANEVWGLGKFLSEDERRSYVAFSDDLLSLAVTPEESTHGLRRVASFRNDCLTNLEGVAREEFVRRLDAWQVSQAMQWHNDWQRGQGA